VFCWGNNVVGQLGDGTNTASNVPVLVTGGRTYSAIASDSAHSCAVSSTNVGWCWGKNGSSELGNGGTVNSSTPVQVSGAQAWSAIAVGALHSCAFTSAGAPHCWGDGSNSQIGDGATTGRTIATAVSGNIVATRLASGWWHNCAIGGTAGASGMIYCWGYNANGQLGDGTRTSRSSPVAVAVPNVTAFSRIDAARYHTCAVTFTGGDIYCWGANPDGQLGDGTTFERLTPTRVAK
jgi:alpha-tubulin suppressor-like RCC1 family protein